MKYDFNGKILNIPDKDLELLEKNLEISKEEAIQCWLDDNDYTVSEEEQELTKKAKAIRHYEKSDKERKKVTKERKVDEEKKRFLNKSRDKNPAFFVKNSILTAGRGPPGRGENSIIPHLMMFCQLIFYTKITRLDSHFLCKITACFFKNFLL